MNPLSNFKINTTTVKTNERRITTMKESINETIKLCCDIVEDICEKCNANEDQLQDCYCNTLETINSNITMDLKDLIQAVSLQTLSYFDEKESLETCPLYIASKMRYTIDEPVIERVSIIRLINRYNNRKSNDRIDKNILKLCNISETVINSIEKDEVDTGLVAFLAKVFGEMAVTDIAKVYGCSRNIIERKIDRVEFTLRNIM